MLACGTHGRDKKIHIILQLRKEEPLVRPRHRWKYKIRMDLKEMRFEDTDSSGSGPGYGIKPCKHGNPTPGFINNRFFNEPNASKPQF